MHSIAEMQSEEINCSTMQKTRSTGDTILIVDIEVNRNHAR